MTDERPANATGEAGNTSDWEGRYTGLQRVLARREQELNAAQLESEQHRQARFDLEAEVENYRLRDRAAQEEREQEAQYTALRAKYEPDAPTPRLPNPAREPSKRDEPFDAQVALANVFPD